MNRREGQRNTEEERKDFCHPFIYIFTPVGSSMASICKWDGYGPSSVFLAQIVLLIIVVIIKAGLALFELLLALSVAMAAVSRSR